LPESLGANNIPEHAAALFFIAKKPVVFSLSLFIHAVGDGKDLKKVKDSSVVSYQMVPPFPLVVRLPRFTRARNAAAIAKMKDTYVPVHLKI
jgi:hypothetical protein